MTESLTTAFARLTVEGRLRADDPQLAAEHYIWLVLSIPLNRAMLLGDEHGLLGGDLERYADAGVRVFLTAYGTPSDLSAMV